MASTLSQPSKRAVLASLVAAMAAGLLSCQSGPPQRPNIVFIVVDALRSDHLPSYGYPHDTAPRLHQLAERGVLFERVIAPSSWTKTSMASIMTSRIPDRHNVRGVKDVLGRDLPTLPRELSASGYETMGVNTNPWIEPKFGFAAGFDVYETHVSAPARKVNRRALALLNERRREPRFLYLHYMDVHAPYLPDSRHFREPPLEVPGHGPMPDGTLEWRYRKKQLDAPGVRERAIRLYDAGIRATDDAIGHLLDELRRRGWLDNTIVVLTSDHGEAFREHGTTEHGWNLYPEVYEVPLVLVWPGRIPAGKRIREQVRSIDVAPTLMELAGLALPAAFEGQSLLPFDVGKRRDRVAVCAVGLNDYIPSLDYVAVISPDHLYIRERKHDVIEFYALRSDPGARNDLGSQHSSVASYAALEGPGPVGTSEQTTLDEPTKERLRSLGYLHGE